MLVLGLSTRGCGSGMLGAMMEGGGMVVGGVSVTQGPGPGVRMWQHPCAGSDIPSVLCVSYLRDLRGKAFAGKGVPASCPIIDKELV
jgi:hypothetical protein